MVTDPIADYLSRIRNGYLAGKTSVSVPHSKMKIELSKILEKEGYLKSSKIKAQISKRQTEHKTIEIQLQYKNDKPAIETIKRVSTPGRRMYVDKNNIPYVLSGFGIAILSTSKGLITDKMARKKGLGGEIICFIS